LVNENNNTNNSNSSKNNNNSSSINLFNIAVSGILLTTVYTAILASQLLSTKRKVDYLYYKENFSEKKN